MIDRVVKAIAKQETLNQQVQSFVYSDVHVIRDILKPYGEQELFSGGDSEECRQVHADIKESRIARAAIEAMRDVPEVMYRALACDGIWKAPEKKGETYQKYMDPADAWRGLIDIALKESDDG